MISTDNNCQQTVRSVGVVSVGRSDFGIYRPILQAIQKHPGLQLRLIVSGAHLSPVNGLTIEEVRQSGFKIYEQVDMLLSSNTPEGTVKSMGLGLIGFAQVYRKANLDLLLVLGDRFEMFVAALAALPFRLPVAHLHGGEITEGAIDDALRHSITKLSHLHFVATEEYARRVIQMGEEPWRVIVSGAPALESLAEMAFLTVQELKESFGIQMDPSNPPLLITLHPETLAFMPVEEQIQTVLAALEVIDVPLIFTAPNADAGGTVIREAILNFVRQHPKACFVENFGARGYFSVLRMAGAVVGNSSSGILEAASFGVPVVNIGDRQKGRLRAQNVIDVPYSPDALIGAIHAARSELFRSPLKTMVNPFWKANSSAIIVQTLFETGLNQRLLAKRFYDFPV